MFPKAEAFWKFVEIARLLNCPPDIHNTPEIRAFLEQVQEYGDLQEYSGYLDGYAAAQENNYDRYF